MELLGLRLGEDPQDRNRRRQGHDGLGVIDAGGTDASRAKQRSRQRVRATGCHVKRPAPPTARAAQEVISEAARKAGIANPLRFAGQYFDRETGLHYNRHRYYDPTSGRFVSKDPIGLVGSINVYAYGSNNPIGRVDPLGLDPLLQGSEPYQLQLFPSQPYSRGMYGSTPTAAQQASVPQGMEFDHDPPLVQHYYEGDKQGGLAGYNMTPAERKAYAARLDCGCPAMPGAQRR
ncbi:RHS repeat-associated core domain-containing protein [Burkholderia plantarii]|nr:RHS repeat-associated core domain-containing protein [Burkholderia plantarii]